MKKKGFTLIEHERSKSVRRNEGFTLIELLVVIAVIGLLASIVLVSLGPARKKARDARRQSDIRQISTAMEMCLDDSTCGNEKYIAITGGTAPVPARITAPAAIAGGTVTYLTLPSDPGGGSGACDADDKAEMAVGQYCAITSALGANYCIFAKLSDGNFFTASDEGVRTETTYPTVLATCK